MNFWIALGAGYFEAEDLQVQPISPPRPDAAGRFLMMGSGDVAILPGPMVVDLIGEGQPFAVFANLLTNDPINLVLRKEVADQMDISPNAPLKEKLQALKGIKIGVAAGPITRLRILFQSVGLNADEHLEIVTVGGPSQNSHFGEGRVDALYAHTPFLETALVRQDAVTFIDQSGGEVPDLAGRQIHFMVALRSYIDENSNKVEKLTRAIFRAQELAGSDVDATIAALRVSGIQGFDEELITTIVEIYDQALPTTPAVSVEGMEFLLRIYPDHKQAPDLTGVDFSQYVAPEFADKVVSE